MKAPEKIFVHVKDGKVRNTWNSEWIGVNDIEYTHTDAFIEKACNFIRKMVDIPHSIECKDGQPLVDDYIKYAEERLKAAEKVVEDFKKYMEGE